MAEENIKRTPEEIEAGIVKAKAEALKAQAEARKLEAEARGSEVALRALEYSERELLSEDVYHRVYRFSGDVSPGTVRECIKRLSSWSRMFPGEPMTIIFNSPGGDVVNGLALFDFIQELRRDETAPGGKAHHVTTKAQGYSASMAGILLQAGDVRIMDAEAWLLIHEAAFFAMGKIGEVEDTVEWVKRICKRVVQIFATRSKLTPRMIEKNWRRKDWWIDADEAYKLGLCDRIEGALLETPPKPKDKRAA